MHLTTNIQKAINMASRLHASQVRKGDNGLPYISHSFSVAWILAEHTSDEDTIVAGLLHDVLEDVHGYSISDLAKDFGSAVATIVQEVSEDKDPYAPYDDKETWQKRKNKYLIDLHTASLPAIMVSAADKIHNLRSLAASYAEQGETLWQRFNAPADKRLWFYQEVANIVSQRLPGALADELAKEIKNLETLLDGFGELKKTS